ncbi:MAG: hypothetical protein HUJ22_06685 [Gracilimonas sp.]|uniref:chemotaxis protein CheB n=1 Tax=Gracilimonas sp. TaxID=1974203 RepID=UPI001994ECD9|nr:chemotaxis protein CheB [Gracilimonas sp.]MBD3616246.1 hypothetical protein [Gracilimonas sp.]
MKPINIFILDANEIVRRRLQDAVTETTGLNILLSGSSTEHDIRTKIKDAEPDLIVMGIDHHYSEEMRLFNYLRNQHAHLPILVMTPHNRDGATVAITTLKKGAVEFFPKSTTLSGSILTVDFFKERLIPIIKITPRLNRNVLLSQHFVDTAVKKIEPIPDDFFNTSLSRMELLVIAGCLGGVAPLYLLLSSLPKNLPVPIVVVQHMVEIYSKVLAEDLDKYTKLSVKEAEHGEELKAGHVYIAPGDYHTLTYKKDQKIHLTLNHGPKVAGFRPSIDILLKSTAQQFGKRMLTVYLSGGGNDGIEGAKIIDIIGGQIIIQNARTSLLSDIPWKVESYGINEGAYPVERLGHEISKRLV